jgi:hypothetical protein
MVRDQPVDDPSASVQVADRSFLIGLHEPAITGHVGGKNCGQAALHAYSPSVRRLGHIPINIHKEDSQLKRVVIHSP